MPTELHTIPFEVVGRSQGFPITLKRVMHDEVVKEAHLQVSDTRPIKNTVWAESMFECQNLNAKVHWDDNGNVMVSWHQVKDGSAIIGGKRDFFTTMADALDFAIQMLEKEHRGRIKYMGYPLTGELAEETSMQKAKQAELDTAVSSLVAGMKS